jgi:hypothetical protein
MRYLISSFICFLFGCAGQKALNLQFDPVNPNAVMAFFNETNLSRDMKLEYASALQNAGLYNFKMDEFSENQIENGVEIRLNYTDKKGILTLNAEFLRNGQLISKFEIKEDNKKEKKKLRKKVLLEMFLEETKRTQFEKQAENNNV